MAVPEFEGNGEMRVKNIQSYNPDHEMGQGLPVWSHGLEFLSYLSSLSVKLSLRLLSELSVWEEKLNLRMAVEQRWWSWHGLGRVYCHFQSDNKQVPLL